MSNEWKKSRFNVLSKIPKTDKVILYNSAKGSIICLNESVYEKFLEENLDEETFKKFCEHGFFVSQNKDELNEVKKLRDDAIQNDEGIARFTIATTLACNARCFYCFEPENQFCTMDEKTIDATIDFIKKQGNGKNIGIHWFGGEPLMNLNAIKKITEAIKATIGDKKYFSSIATNATLFNDKIISKLDDWSINFVQVTIDGTEKEYLKRKNYVSKEQNQYKVVMENIEKLLKNGTFVKVRINVDKENIKDSINLINDLTEKFKKKYENFSVYVFPLSGNKNDDRFLKENELKEPLIELYAELFKNGYLTNLDQLNLNPRKIHCGACKPNSFNIDPSGKLFKCEHLIGRDEHKIGDVFNGITFQNRYENWVTSKVNNKCQNCKLLPVCQGGCLVNKESNLGCCLPIKPLLEDILVLGYGIYLKGECSNE